MMAAKRKELETLRRKVAGYEGMMAAICGVLNTSPPPGEEDLNTLRKRAVDAWIQSKRIEQHKQRENKDDTF